MFKAGRWRSEKNKIKAVFRLQFHATQVTEFGWETAMVSLVPLDVGKPTARSDKAALVDGVCQWRKPIYETVKLIQDPRTGKINDKLYNFIVSATGSGKAAVLGEITVNLSDYAEVLKPSSISLPLKASSSGAILHVIIQKVQTDAGKSDADEHGGRYVREQKRKITGQLNHTEEEGSKCTTANVKPMEDDSFSKNQAQLRLSNITMPSQPELSDIHKKSGSFDTISAFDSDGSSAQYTPKEDRMKNNGSHKDSVSFLSSFSDSGAPQTDIANSIDLITHHRDHRRPITNLFIDSGTDGSMDRSINSLAETGLGESLQDSDGPTQKLQIDVDALARQVDVLELELQTLRRQVVKETRHGQDLSRELGRLKEERDALKRECEELKASQKRINNEHVSNKCYLDGEDPRSIVEEIKQELNHEKNLNANLHLQLQKTHESNSELILAVQDLEELLEQKKREMACTNCSLVPIKPANGDDFTDMKLANGYANFKISEYKKEELFETIFEDDSEQYALELLVKGSDHVNEAYSLEQKIRDLNSEIEMYKKDREDLEMHMEQLALDYEILKQENHEITSKLEQTQLQEQLRMQYECSAHLSIISDLEAHVNNLKNEIEEQAEAFEADLESVMHAKVQQEQRAIQAEEALRKTRWNNANTAEQLQKEFERLSAQMSSAFQTNEKLAMQAQTEASELRLQKSFLEELLEKTKEEQAVVQGKCHVKLEELLNLVNVRTTEADSLLRKLKERSEELENQKRYADTREKAFLKEMLTLKAKTERLSRENARLSEQLKQKEKSITEMEQLKASIKEETEMSQDISLKSEVLNRELTSMRTEAEISGKELHELRDLMDEKERVTDTLNSELTTLRAQCDDLKHSLFEDELEKENLRKQVFHLQGDLRKKEDKITGTEKKLKDSNARLTTATKTTVKNKNNKSGPTPEGSKEVARLHEKIKLLEGKIKLKDAELESTKNSFLKKEKDLSNKIEEFENSTGQTKPRFSKGLALMDDLFNGKNGDNSEDERDKSVKLQQPGIAQSQMQEVKNLDGKLDRTNINGKILLQCKAGAQADRIGIDEELSMSIVGTGLENNREDLISNNGNLGSLAEVLSEMAVLKEKNEAMEAELKEMQERYSQISLKFAEVEGERQQLVMTVRTLKNAPKN